MKVHSDINQVPAFRKAVVTIGMFDGVHKGHQQVIHQLKAEADKIGGETVIITFHPHPRNVVSSDVSIKLLTTLEEKIELLEGLGVDHLVIMSFTKSFSELSAEAYIKEFLVACFRPHTVIVGYDHRFGKGRAGSYRMLEEFSASLEYTVKEIPQQVLQKISVSSTRIRESLVQGELEVANELLGYDYFFEGKVIEGNKLGRTIGYPTANLEMKDAEKLVPGNGVYAVTIENLKEPGVIRNGMMNIGLRPTVDGRQRVIEVNIFDFDKDIYGDCLRVSLKQFLRSEEKFSGLDALKEQLARDKHAALTALSGRRY
jgi:riboflavin kinase/FMN adenylyltransferase